VSPILIRPVREQLEHDRLIRHLVAKYKRKSNDVNVNPAEEQATPVKIGAATLFPDLVLTEGGRLTGVIEVESGESVNNLEALAQWVPFAKARVPFHLYVPVQFYDAAKRLCDARDVRVTEIWTYRGLIEGFDLVRMHHDPTAGVPRGGAAGAAARLNAESNGGKAAAPKPAASKPIVAKPTPAAPAPKNVAKPTRPVKSGGKTVAKATSKGPAKPVKNLARKPAPKMAPKPVAKSVRKAERPKKAAARKK
jgi:hypothetical protein